MSFPIEDFERVKTLDEMYIQEKQHDMYVEWQMYEEEQEKLTCSQERQPARIEILTPLPKKQEHEYKGDALPF